MIDTLSASGWLFLVVAFGAIVPIVPTGAAVSATAAYAFHQHVYAVVPVVLAGAAGAYLGDLVMYAMCRFGGERMARRLRWMRDEHRLTTVTERLRGREVPVLLVSRLIPGGRVPVLLAAAFAGLPWRTFVVANLPACALWSAVYATIGLLGGSLFPEPWQGVLAAVVLILLVNQCLSWFSKRRDARTSDASG
ncbi:VTT domain-containing protein [Actinoplanes sp. NPDC026670]|uniref:DedA family protein n=1 Tax=Actinoplanes sp. NPDC026670 TaxID=3154700 RepID=UPI0033C52608